MTSNNTPAEDRTPTAEFSAAEPSPTESTGSPPTPPRLEAFEPAHVRPWRFHNRAGSGMDAVSINELAESIARNGQQQPGLARRLPAGDTHEVEVIYGVRRLEACRIAGIPWQAEVCEATVSDARCAALMHGENAHSEGVSPLENAVQWQAMLDQGVFASQSALAAEIGCHRGTVARAVRTARALFSEEWLAELVRPVMHQFSGRAADRLADTVASGLALQEARRRARALSPGHIPASSLYDALYGKARPSTSAQTLFVRRRGTGGGGGAVAARILRDPEGGWSVTVKPHEQSPADLADLAEQVESLVQRETSGGAAVRLGRRLAASLTPEEAVKAQRSWLEGCVWAWAHALGLEWDGIRCAVAAEILRTQPEGWQRAIVQVSSAAETGND